MLSYAHMYGGKGCKYSDDGRRQFFYKTVNFLQNTVDIPWLSYEEKYWKSFVSSKYAFCSTIAMTPLYIT